jgi:hypothetical protein
VSCPKNFVNKTRRYSLVAQKEQDMQFHSLLSCVFCALTCASVFLPRSRLFMPAIPPDSTLESQREGELDDAVVTRRHAADLTGDAALIGSCPSKLRRVQAQIGRRDQRVQMIGKIECFPAQLKRALFAKVERTGQRHVELDQPRSFNGTVAHAPISTHCGNLERILIEKLDTRDDVHASLALVR